MVTEQYDKAFYDVHYQNSKRSAQFLLPHVLSLFPGIKSAVDVGCGTGIWLSVLREMGVETIQGIDGDWVLGAGVLAIPRESFQPVDLNKPINLDRKFDLAISMEVAEHLDPASSHSFVGSLTRLSDTILFSAAIPGQPGTNHINERWPDYWISLFQKENFEVLDVIRGKVWNDPRISYYYQQNAFLFLNKNTHFDMIKFYQQSARPPLCIVHPELYLLKDRLQIRNIFAADISVRQASKLLAIRVKKSLERRLFGSR